MQAGKARKPPLPVFPHPPIDLACSLLPQSKDEQFGETT